MGLQNLGLLVLESGNMKRDTWTSSFGDIVFALDFPDRFKPPTVITPPIAIPGSVVHIPDPILRAAIAETLGKNPNAPITVEEMEELVRLNLGDHARSRGIRDLTGLEFATNLRLLHLWYFHEFNDFSPIAGLISLESIIFGSPNISDLSPLAGLINLKKLHMNDSKVSDLSPLAGLIKLEWIHFDPSNISDLSPLAGLINLERCCTWGSPTADLSPLAGLPKLEAVVACGAGVSDLTPLAEMRNLKKLDLRGNDVSDISLLAGLTKLEWLDLSSNDISDISPLAELNALTWLNVLDNDISDVTPLAGLTNLTWLSVAANQISDFSPLDRLRENTTLLWHHNPGFPKGGPKIEGPWLWVVLPDTTLDSDTDLLSEASGGGVTEVEVATHGAIEGGFVGSSVWTSHKLPTTGWTNIKDMLKRTIRGGVIYGSVSLHSPRQQETTMYVGGEQGIKVWLNGVLMHQHNHRSWANDYSDFFPVTLQQGRNVLLVAVHTDSSGFFWV